MKPINATFELVKIDDDNWDVLIFSELPVLKAFNSTYSNLFFVEKSVFNKLPMVVVPSFGNKKHAEVWIEYWKVAFSDPDNSCQSCPTVRELFEKIENSRLEQFTSEAKR